MPAAGQQPLQALPVAALVVLAACGLAPVGAYVAVARALAGRQRVGYRRW